MNKYLTNLVLNTIPHMNLRLINGELDQYVDDLPDQMETFIKDALLDLNDGIKVIYKSKRVMLPEEELARVNSTPANPLKESRVKQFYDIATYDTYAVEYTFEYNKTPISRIVYFPFIRDSNLIRLSGNWYHILPILSDTIISPTNSKVFVRLDKDKFIVEWRDFEILRTLDNRTMLIRTALIHTIISRLKYNRENPDYNALDTPVMLYVLAKYGIRKTLQSTFGVANDEQFFIIDSPDDPVCPDPRYKYYIYRSTNKRKKYHKVWSSDKTHNFAVVVRNDLFALLEDKRQKYNNHNDEPDPISYTKKLEDFIASMIYAFDIIPSAVSDIVTLFNSKDQEDEAFKWLMVLGRIAFKNAKTYDKTQMDIIEAYKSLKNYVSKENLARLEEADIYNVTDFFTLLIEVFKRFHMLLRTSNNYNSNSKHRYLDIRYYVLYYMKESFNKNFIIELNKRSNKKQQSIYTSGDLSFKEVKQALTAGLKTKAIYNLIRASKDFGYNLCVNIANVYGDIKYLKVTSLLEDQSRGKGVNRAIAKFNKSKSIPDFAKYLRGDDLYLGSLLYINKATISPRFKINTYLKYHRHNGKLNIPEDIQMTIKKINTLLDTAEEDKDDGKIITLEAEQSLDKDIE